MRILVAGDFCEKNRVVDYIEKNRFDDIFDNVKELISQYELKIVNFEFPIVKTAGSPIQKCGPNLKGHEAAIDSIKYAGFNLCTLANNHILDQGEQCCLDTKELLERKGIMTVGVGDNIQNASSIYYYKNNDETLAVINCCETEFSVATEKTAGSNPLDPIKIYYKIIEAKTNSDYVLIIVHGGHEHFQYPSPRMQDTYRFFIDAGADVVVNHHQHCFSGYELYHSKPIFYGLGNFLFDRIGVTHTIWNEGFFVGLTLSKNKQILFDLFPYNQCNEKVTVSLCDELEIKVFNEKIRSINEVIADRNKLNEVVEQFYNKSAKSYTDALEPYNNRLSKFLYNKGIFPSMFSKKQWLKLYNCLRCESHKDRFIYAVNKKISE